MNQVLSKLQKKAIILYKQFLVLRKELTEHSQELVNKSYLIGVNKMDIYSDQIRKKIQQVFSKNKKNVTLFSAPLSFLD